MTLRNIVKNAYGIRDDARLRGAPGWLDSERFDINARAAEDADKAQVFLMLRSLLAERFKMTAHNETDLMPVYILQIAKGGAKPHELKAGGRPKESSPDMRAMTVMGPISGLTTLLARLMERPVVDQKGLTGKYDMTLMVPREDAPASFDGHGSALLASFLLGALEEQLGLKLQASKAPVDVLVIDHVERPSEN